ncbi:hypothetical protein B0H14DRAFT_2922784 [Mycena olivaceomarginata]|nr:hypothetical protein B0H14DRAFT_2922784 [Mycena olivaceomarginata]
MACIKMRNTLQNSCVRSATHPFAVLPAQFDPALLDSQLQDALQDGGSLGDGRGLRICTHQFVCILMGANLDTILVICLYLGPLYLVLSFGAGHICTIDGRVKIAAKKENVPCSEKLWIGCIHLTRRSGRRQRRYRQSSVGHRHGRRGRYVDNNIGAARA